MVTTTTYYPKARLYYALLGFLFLGSISQVDGHGVEVRHCLTTDGNLRIFVEHWHGDLSSVAEPGGIDIRNDITGIVSTLTPTGLANNVDVDNGGSLPGCPAGTTPTIATTCPNEVWNDWVYYDFPFSCDTNISFTLIQGLTFYLTEACSGLYPATISPYENCANAPSRSPSEMPSVAPSQLPSSVSEFPSSAPSCSKGKGSCPKSTKGTKTPSVNSTKAPYVESTKAPTKAPYVESTKAPYVESTKAPTKAPYVESTKAPYVESTKAPYVESTKAPYVESTKAPYAKSTKEPTKAPTKVPVATKAPAASKAPSAARTPVP